MKKKKKVEKGGLIKHPKIKKLTPTEEQVLNLITEEFLTIKQVSLRRQTSIQAVYKTLKKLKEKGALTGGLKEVEKNQGSDFKPSNQIRLHGQEFNIKILYQDKTYQKQLNKSNILFLEGHTIKLYRNSIEVYAGEGTSFFADNPDRAFSKSLKYWKKFFHRLEHELKSILIKPRSRNIRQVNAHYARGNSEISEKAIEEHKQIRIYAEEDGKLAFITDDSFGFKEDETVHPKTSKPDRKAIDKQVNDWRKFNPPTNSQLSTHLAKLIKINTKDMIKREEYSRDIVEHKEAIKKLGRGINKLTKVIGGVLEENKNLKLQLKNQKRLGEFL